MSDNLKWQHAVTIESHSSLTDYGEEDIDFDKLRPDGTGFPAGWEAANTKWALWHVAAYNQNEMGGIQVVWRRLIKEKKK